MAVVWQRYSSSMAVVGAQFRPRALLNIATPDCAAIWRGGCGLALVRIGLHVGRFGQVFREFGDRANTDLFVIAFGCF